MQDNSKTQINICKAVSLRVAELLRKHNMSQYRLEQNSGVSHSALDFIMKNSHQTVNFKIVVQLSQGFKMTLLEFLDSPYFDYDKLDLD